jgi:predicted O-methyltransferase YrrM
MIHIKIEKDKVKSMDLTELEKYSIVDGPDFSEAGIEAYKFYAYLSTLVNNTKIVEIGTRYGKSALALSFNSSNKIISFDILEQGASQIKKDNISFVIGDFTQAEGDWSKVDIIMIDVDPHDGIKEREFISFLYSVGWEGILILDDILPNWPVIVSGANPVEMNNWWNSISEEKYDVSDIGHFSGTGIVNIGSKFTIELC